MSKKTLYLLQSTFAHTAHCIGSLNQTYSSDDAIVFTGESVLYVNDAFFQNKQNLYILENDAEVLLDSIPKNIQLINYSDFADLILTFKRCISLK